MAYSVAMVLPRDRISTSVLKWLAPAIQNLGYTATAYGLTPWNSYLFLVGIFGWFLVGVLWKDRALVLVHLVAFMAMLSGLSQ